uniref:Tis11 family protein n=1 Tax=Crassostrea virginica TaxID=6565 RepID=O16809_CRAVI|nr:Tis11 family protein [Crassostrea virginica]
MSTELYPSAFYDVGDLLYKQNKKNLMKNQMNERRATVTAATMSPAVVKARTMSTNSFIPIGGQPLVSVSSQGGESCLINNPESLHRKLDRSMSEPGATLSSAASRQQNQNVNSSRYKTELCRPFEESGHCKYGDKCQFAHGAHELRNLNRHPKYKTELCRTFHTIGFCPYGPRCHFIHNDEERNQNVNKNHPAMMTTATTVQQTFPSRMDQISQVKRPTNFSSSFNGSLGSSSESLSSSASDSPSLSPIFWGTNEDIFRDFSSSSQYSSSGSSSPVFDYSADPASSLAASLLTPLNVQTATTANQNLASEINILQQQINVIMNLSNQCNNNNPNVFDSTAATTNTWDLAPPAPHSPPDSISGDSLGSASSGSCGSINTCGSPLDVSKCLRLPIFNKLSQDD